MERLTMNNGICQMASTEFCLSQKDCYSCPHGRKCFKRLAAYENTMPLERAQELVQADKDGRLVVLPCKVVYIPTWDAGEKCDLACPVTIDGEGCCDLCDKSQQFIYEKQCRQEHIDQIGKTVFLTREEAEAALKKGEEADTMRLIDKDALLESLKDWKQTGEAKCIVKRLMMLCTTFFLRS